MEISTNRNKWIVEWANEIIYAEIPIWEKCILTCTLTIEEAAKYFRIGEKKLRQLADEHPNANWLIMNGNRVQIKRKQFEKMIDSMEVI